MAIKCFSCLANLLTVFLRIGEIYLGIEQFICAEIDSGKSCRLGFLQLFNKAFGYLLPSVLLCSLLTSQAQVKSMSHFSLIQSAPDWILAAWKNGDDALQSHWTLTKNTAPSGVEVEVKVSLWSC